MFVVDVGERRAAVAHLPDRTRRPRRSPARCQGGHTIAALARALALIAACIALLGGAASTASAAPTPAPPEFFGANLQALFRQGFVKAPNFSPYLSAQSAGGMPIGRFDAPWMWAEPKAPGAGGHVYDWSQLDGIAATLASHNLRWLPVVDLPPAWAKTSGNSLSPGAYEGFAAFAGAFAARYGANGTFWALRPDLPRLPVQQVEVWTEANSTHFWNPSADSASEYLAVFAQVRAAIKAADPTQSVLLSLGWQDFEGFMSRFYAAGGKGQTDGVAFHPYAPTARGVVVLTRRLRDLLTAQGEPDLPIFMTEIGWPQTPSGAGAVTAYDGPVSDASRAATSALTADALAASDCNVKNYVFYSLVEEQKNPANIEDWLGLLNIDATPTMTFSALAAASQRWTASGFRAASSKMLPLCHGPANDVANASNTMQPNGQMPLQLDFPMPVTSKCFTVQAKYFGNPLEDVSIFVRSYVGSQGGSVTKANGQGQLCLSAASRKKPFLVWARSGALASSTVQYCKGKRCYPMSCKTASLRRTTFKRLSGRRVRVSVGVRCGERVLFRQPIKISAVDRKGNVKSLKRFFTGTTAKLATYVITVPKNARKVRVGYGGDKAFRLAPRAKSVRADASLRRTPTVKRSRS